MVAHLVHPDEVHQASIDEVYEILRTTALERGDRLVRIDPLGHVLIARAPITPQI